MRKSYMVAIIAALAAVVVLMLFWALTGKKDPAPATTVVATPATPSQPANTGTSSSSANAQSNADNRVIIANMAFAPTTITVAAHSAVRWTNNDSVDHTVTTDDGSLKSGTIEPNGNFGATFDTPGTYTYHCSLHPNMIGTIIVTSATSQ